MTFATPSEPVEVCVQGRGPVGMALALALARAGRRVAWVAPPPDAAPPAADPRRYALNAASRRLLQGLRAWEALDPAARTAVQAMEVVGDGGARLNFSAAALGEAALAWIVDAAALEAALHTALRYAPHVQAVPAPVPAALQALCEGRDGATAARWGAQVEAEDYGQIGLATRLLAGRPHQGVAWQAFAAPAVLALLPCDGAAGAAYALVWSLPAGRAAALRTAPAEAFEAELAAAQEAGGLAGAGPLRLADPDPAARAGWPLRRARARLWHGPVPEPGLQPRPGPPAAWVLLGDAAHNVHPLAGQGLNLGFGDVAALVDALATPGPAPLQDARRLAAYARRRAAPTGAMLAATDGLWSLFAHPDPLLGRLRNLGLAGVERLPPLKAWLARQALGV